MSTFAFAYCDAINAVVTILKEIGSQKSVSVQRLGYGAGRLVGNLSRFPGRGKNFCLLGSVQTGSRARAESCSIHEYLRG